MNTEKDIMNTVNIEGITIEIKNVDTKTKLNLNSDLKFYNNELVETNDYKLIFHAVNRNENLYSFLKFIFQNTYFKKIYNGFMIIDILEYNKKLLLPYAECLDNSLLRQYIRVKVVEIYYKHGDIIDMYLTIDERKIIGKNEYCIDDNIKYDKNKIIKEKDELVYKLKENKIKFNKYNKMKIREVIASEGMDIFKVKVDFIE